MNKLKFETLRLANEARLPLFKNARGEPAHSEPDGSDWSPLEWAGAAAGEAGELANICKKVRRGDLTKEEARADAAKECADVVCYVDLVAKQFGIDLGQAVMDKFNEVSARVGAPVTIEQDSRGNSGVVVGGKL